MLLAMVDDEAKTHCRQSRSKTGEDYQKLDSSLAPLRPDGVRDYDGLLTACNATSGRLRLARRGETVYFLFAEDDSSTFQLLRTENVSEAPLQQAGIQLKTYCNGDGDTRVSWT